MQFLWHLFALVLTSSPRLVDWLIRRAQRTPYTDITSADGQHTYMGRWWLFNPYGRDQDGEQSPARFPWLPSVRIHHIMRADQDRDLHDHPWNARTIILRGWYLEERYTWPYEEQKRRQNYLTMFPKARDALLESHLRSAGYTGQLLFGQYHRISDISAGGVWTLFITGRKRGTWGFDVRGKKVPWRTYLGLDKPTMQRGQALVLVGPQGCGKTRMAHELAAQAGPYVQLEVEEVVSPLKLGNALATEPATVIVDVGGPIGMKCLTQLKQLITASHIQCKRHMREPTTVRTPHFIFCTGDRDFLHVSPTDRRFHVVELATPHHPV